MTIYVAIKARCAIYRVQIIYYVIANYCCSVPLFGAILHYLYDFAFEWHEDGGDYAVTNYEVGVVLYSVTMVTPIK